MCTTYDSKAVERSLDGIKILAQSFHAARRDEEALLCAKYTRPPPVCVDLKIMNQLISFFLPPRLAERNYQLLSHWKITLPVEDGQQDISTFPFIDDNALMKTTVISCDGQALTVQRIDFDCLSFESERGPAHGFIVFECDTGSLHLHISRLDEDPSNFLVTEAMWLTEFPVLKKS